MFYQVPQYKSPGCQWFRPAADDLLIRDVGVALFCWNLGMKILLGTTELTCTDPGTLVTHAFPGELSTSEDGWCQRSPGF